MESRLARQLAEAARALHDIDAPFALIGGLALASHGVVRATQGYPVATVVTASES